MKKDLRVLLIEDDENDEWLILRELSHYDFKVISQRVQKEEELKKAILSEHWDVILCDYSMPNLSAEEALRIINQFRLDIPFIVVSGQIGEATAVSMMKAGAHDYLMKNNLRRLGPAIDRELREAEIRKNKAASERLAKILYRGIENTSEIVVITNSIGIIDYVNPAFELMTGFSAQEVIGIYPVILVSTPENSDSQNIWSVALNGGQVWSGSIKCIKKTGDVFDSEMTLSPVFDDQQNIIGCVAIIRDVSEHKAMLQQIIESRNEWEATFNAVSNLIFITDENGNITRCNLPAKEVFCTSGESVIGKNIVTIIFGNSELSDRFLSILHGGIQVNNRDTWYDVSYYPIFVHEKTPLYVFILKDITSAKRIDSALLSSQKYADLGILAAGVAHELKSPLQVVIGVTERSIKRIKKDHLDQESIAANLNMINRNAWRMADIVESLLTYARTSGDIKTNCQINSIVDETLLLTGHQFLVWSNIKITKDLSGSLPEIVGDQNKIAQVLINLLINAKDAMPEGGEITIKTAFDQDSQNVILQIIDTGTGIPDEIVDRIFEPFFTTKPYGSGTGLGLSIVDEIIKDHHATITVGKPEFHHGTVFTIKFPVSERS